MQIEDQTNGELRETNSVHTSEPIRRTISALDSKVLDTKLLPLVSHRKPTRYRAHKSMLASINIEEKMR